MKTTESDDITQLLEELRRKIEDEHIVLVYSAFHHHAVTQEGLAKLFGRTQVAVSRLILRASKTANKTT